MPARVEIAFKEAVVFKSSILKFEYGTVQLQLP